MSQLNEETIRRNVLDEVDRSATRYRLAFVAAVIVEASFLSAFFFLADFHNRTHVLILLAAVATYSIIAIGLMALGAHTKQLALRILKAIELR
jgi:hypothetical protein